MTNAGDGRVREVGTLVIGAGQSGLAAGYHLARSGREFVIVDALPRVGEAWRNRWDSLQLFTPNRYSALPGLAMPGPSRRFPTKNEMATYLETYAARFGLPVEVSTRVERVRADHDRFVVTTDRGSLCADNVIVAVSGVPRVPAFAGEIDPDIKRMHSIDYRRPAQLADGVTLLVGAGNTGGEIALDLASGSRAPGGAAAGSGRRIVLSGRDVGEVLGRIPDLAPLPFWHAVWWMSDTVMSTERRAGRWARRRLQGGGMPRVRATRGKLANAGVEMAPRTVGTRNGRPVLADGTTLDVANIVWCTGFHRDYRWLDIPAILDATGKPIHQLGASPVAGLYFVGLPYQRSLTSALVGGAGKDAAHVVNHLHANR